MLEHTPRILRHYFISFNLLLYFIECHWTILSCVFNQIQRTSKLSWLCIHRPCLENIQWLCHGGGYGSLHGHRSHNYRHCVRILTAARLAVK